MFTHWWLLGYEDRRLILLSTAKYSEAKWPPLILMIRCVGNASKITAQSKYTAFIGPLPVWFVLVYDLGLHTLNKFLPPILSGPNSLLRNFYVDNHKTVI